MNSCFSVAFIRYVFSFDTGEERRQTLDFSVVAFLKSRVLGNPRHLIGGKHDAEAKEHVIRESEQTEEQQRCLHERSQTDCRNLLAPLIEAVGVSTGDAEHIQTTNCHLHEQNAAALDILEEDFDHAVGKGNQTQKVEKSESHLG